MVTVIAEFGLPQLILTSVVMATMLTIAILVDYLKKKEEKAIVYPLVALLLLSLVALLILSIIEIVQIIGWFLGPGYVHEGAESSLHIGSILGLPALFLVTLGTLLVIWDEPKWVKWHGWLAGSSWIITTTNIFLLLTLTPTQMISYSGLIHAFHIFCGGVGLTFGLASALFGISGQRRLAKMTGYITLICWWTAYLLAIFIGDI